MKNSNNTSIVIVFILCLVSVLANAQTTKTITITKTTPVTDTLVLNVSPMDSVAVEIVELTSLYSTIQVQVEINQSKAVASKLLPSFGIEYSQTENTQGVKVTNVTPRKKEVFGTINGRDLQYKRTIKIVVPPNTNVKIKPTK